MSKKKAKAKKRATEKKPASRGEPFLPDCYDALFSRFAGSGVISAALYREIVMSMPVGTAKM